MSKGWFDFQDEYTESWLLVFLMSIVVYIFVPRQLFPNNKFRLLAIWQHYWKINLLFLPAFAQNCFNLFWANRSFVFFFLSYDQFWWKKWNKLLEIWLKYLCSLLSKLNRNLYRERHGHQFENHYSEKVANKKSTNILSSTYS